MANAYNYWARTQPSLNARCRSAYPSITEFDQKDFPAHRVAAASYHEGYTMTNYEGNGFLSPEGPPAWASPRLGNSWRTTPKSP